MNMVHIDFQLSIPSDLLLLLRQMGDESERRKANLWIVGGSVRDALIGKPILDIDLVSETPAHTLGPQLARAVNGTATDPTIFGTLKIKIGHHRIDLATARQETYRQPGALPEVKQGTIYQDLHRRDFSINAIAASLLPNSFGQLLDEHDGCADLQSGLLRALHSLSFQDDPTRMLRATRYASRLDFRIERRTRYWLRRDAAYLNRVSGPRIRREMERMLQEPRSCAVLATAHKLGLLSNIFGPLGRESALATLERGKTKILSPLAAWGVLVYSLELGNIRALNDRLSLTRAQSRILNQVTAASARETLFKESPTLQPIFDLVSSFEPDALRSVSIASTDHEVRSRFRRYMKRDEIARRWVTARDLASLGLSQGPELGNILRTLRMAIIDGDIRTRTSALKTAKKIIEEQSQ